MKPIKDIYTFYRQEAEHAEENRLKVQQRINRISLLRVALFLGGTAAVIHFGTQQYQWAVTAAIVTFIPFLWLMKQHNRLFIRKEYLEKEAMLNRRGIALPRL